MKYWDASALVPIVIAESGSQAMLNVLRGDREIVTWWGTETEVVSAVARHEREAALSATQASTVLARLDALATGVDGRRRLRSGASRRAKAAAITPAAGRRCAAAGKRNRRR